jgi:hypothetical protein
VTQLSFISRFFSPKAGKAASPASAPGTALPTVKFDSTLVSESVMDSIRAKVAEIPEIGDKHLESVYVAAIKSISAGRNLALLCNAIVALDIEGMTRKRAGDISRMLNNTATAMIDTERQISLGIVEAVWRYSGAPCMTNPRKPTAKDIQQDKAHRNADGERFEIAKGMLLNGTWTFPGREDGCRCSRTSVIPGLSE